MFEQVDFSKFLPMLKSKFFIAALAFVVWITLLDENNLIERVQLNNELKQIEKDKTYYLEKIQVDAARLKELQTNDDNLEKFAREQYLMHRENEDVFVLVRE